MSLRSRLAALETLAEGLALVDACDVCGYPAPGLPEVLLLEADEAAPQCPECGRRVDRAGQSIETVIDGRPLPGEVVVLHRRAAAVPLPGLMD